MKAKKIALAVLLANLGAASLAQAATDAERIAQLEKMMQVMQQEITSLKKKNAEEVADLRNQMEATVKENVVVGDIPGSGAGWVTQQAGHGLLTPPGDPGQLAAALRELQFDSNQRQSLGQAGAMALRERFGIEPVAAAIAALYRETLATPIAPCRARY